jgi:hypothetical protein
MMTHASTTVFLHGHHLLLPNRSKSQRAFAFHANITQSSGLGNNLLVLGQAQRDRSRGNAPTITFCEDRLTDAAVLDLARPGLG